MDENNSINASGADDLKRMADAIDRVASSFDKLAARETALASLTQQMEAMVKTISTSLTEILSVQTAAQGRRVASAKAAAAEEASAVEKGLDKMLFDRNKFYAAAEAAQEAAASARINKATATAMKELEAEMAAENKRAAALQASYDRAAAISEAAAAASWQTLLSFEAKKTATLEAELRKRRALEEAAAAASWQNTLDLEAKKAAAAEKQRVLNTNFTTSSLASQIATAEKAAVYGSLGGNASERYGSAAAGANLAELRRQLAAMPPAAASSTAAIAAHNEAMAEGHALARGLAGSLGGLWLTYGSLIPLAAGAALAASLKNVVTVGKEVEYQLKFVQALSQEAVPLDNFLAISGGTVVGIKDAAEGMRALAQNGLSVKDSLAVLPAVLNLATIGEMGVEQAALAATGALSAFGLQIGDIERVGDILAKTAASSNTSVAAMTESLKQGSIAASLYGVSIEETSAALGTLAKINIVGSQAGTAYSNLLTSLYAPTKQATKALDELGVSAKNVDGSLKNSSVLLAELRNALSKYNESAQANYIGDITNNRGAKAVSTLLQYLDDYEKKIQEARDATGFMSDAVTTLGDSTEGAFKRLKNSMDETFIRAFSQSQPALQALVDGLAQVARSEGATRILTNLAAGTVSLAQGAVSSAKEIGVLVAAVSTVTLGMKAWTGATTLYTTALAGAEAATITFTTATRLAMGVLGPLALLIGGLTLAYQLYNAEIDKQEQANQKIQNSTRTRIDMLDSENKSLEKRIELIREKLRLEGDKGDQPAAPTTLQAAAEAMNRLNAAAAAAKKTVDNAMSPTKEMLANYANLSKQAEEAQANYYKLSAAETANKGLNAEQKTLNDRAALIKQLEDLAKKSEVIKTIGGKDVAVEDQSNEAARGKAAEALDILEKFKSNSLTYTQALAAYTETRRDYNASLQDRPKTATNDELNAQVQQLQGAKQLFDIQQRTKTLELDAARAAGRVGELEYLRQKTTLERQSLTVAYDTAMSEAALMSAADKKRGAEQKYTNQANDAIEKGKQLLIQQAAAEQAYFTQLDKENLTRQADALQARGQLVDAYLLKFEADTSQTVSGLQSNIKALESDITKALESGDTSNVDDLLEKLGKLNTALNAISQRRSAGVDTALFAQLKTQFDTLINSIQGAVQEAQAKGTEEGGLAGMLGVSDAAESIQRKLLPTTKELWAQLKAIAETSNNPELAKAFEEINKKYQQQVNTLEKATKPFGDTWKSIWKTVDQSAHDAFVSWGKSGVDTMKKIKEAIKTSILDMLYQLTIKKWIIEISTNVTGALSSITSGGSALSTLLGGSSESTGAAGGSSTMASILGGASNLFTIGKAIYGGLTSGITGSLASSISSAGSLFGSEALSAFGAGMQGGALGAGTASASSGYAGSAAASYGAGAAKAIPIVGWIIAGMEAANSFMKQGFTPNNGTITNPIFKAISAPTNLVYSSLSKLGVGSTLANILSGAAINTKLFGRADPVVTSQGVRGTISDTGIAGGESYANILEKGGWFRSDKRYTNTAALPSDFSNSLVSGFTQVKVAAAGYAAVLGLSTDVLKDYTKAFDISLGSDQTKNTDAITAFFAQVGDELSTKLLPSIASFSKVGEAASATLQRLAGDYKSTDTIAQLLGKTGVQAFGAIGIASLTAREQFINMSGGIDALSSKLTSYSQNYLTTQEQNAPVIAALNAEFAKLNVKVPTTREEFKALVSGLDLTDAAQVSTFNSLMDLQAAFAQVTPAVDKAAETANILSQQAQLYELTGDKAAAAAVLEQQHQLALKGMSAELAAATQAVWGAQKATAAREDQKSILDQQAQLYEITGNKTAAAAVLEQQHQLALQNMSVELAAATQAVWDAQKAEAAKKEALDEQKAILEQQAQLYEITGDKAAAAAVLEQQHQLALKDMSAALAEATKATWAAQASQQANQQRTQDMLSELQLQSQISEALGNSAGKAAAQIAIQTLQLQGLTPALAALNKELYVAQASKGVTDAYQDLVTKSQSAVDALTKFADSLDNLQQTLNQGDLSTLTPEQKLAKAKVTYEDTVAKAIAGDETAQGNLSSVAQDYLKASRAYNASNPTYAADATRVQNDITKLATSTRSQISVQKDILATAKAQLDALGLQTSTTASGLQAVADAVKALGQAIATLNSTKDIKTPSGDPSQASHSAIELAITSFYRNILEREPDAPGLANWIEAYNKGVSLDTIASDFYKSDEYLSKHSHAKGGMAYGVSLVGERGPELVDFTHPAQVYPAAQTAGMFARGPQASYDPVARQLLESLVREAQAANAQRAAIAEREEELAAADLDEQRRAQRVARSNNSKN